MLVTRAPSCAAVPSTGGCGAFGFRGCGMSGHSVKAKRRHPDPAVPREAFQVAHVTVEVIDHPEHGATFALIAGEAVHARDRRPLFSGHVEVGMGTQLRRLAHRIDEIEARMRGEGSE